MKDYDHGGDTFSYIERFGLHPVDFSVNVNPYPLPETVKKAYIEAFAEAGIYPDHRLEALRKEILNYELRQHGQLLLGSGASDIIFKLFHSLRPQSTLIAVPTFSEYEKAALISGGEAKFHYLEEKESFALSDKFAEDIKDVSAVVLCNPNNPTGISIDEKSADKVIEKCAEKKTLLIVDECFAEFCSDFHSFKKYLDVYPNLIIIKAFTKVFGMAGLRLGYALSSNSDMIDRIDEAGPCWNLSAPSIACAKAILKDGSYLEKSLKVMREEKAFLLSQMKNLPLKIYGHEANFIFFGSNDTMLAEKLEKRGVMIRDCSNFRGVGKGFYRIGARLRKDNEILIEALRHEFEG